MRIPIPISLLAAALLGAGTASAAELPFTGTLRVEFTGSDPAVIAISVAGAGTALVNGSGAGGALTALELAGGTFATDQLLPVTDPIVAPIRGFLLSVQNGAAAFGASGGVMPLAGFARLCLFEACASGPPGNVSVPLSVIGAGGSVTWEAAVNATVVGAPWTTATASVGVLTRMGSVGGPLGNPASAAAASGHIQLVTPIFILTNLGADNIVPGFATLTLHFVPEPVSLLLLAGGVAGIALARRGA